MQQGQIKHKDNAGMNRIVRVGVTDVASAAGSDLRPPVNWPPRATAADVAVASAVEAGRPSVARGSVSLADRLTDVAAAALYFSVFPLQIARLIGELCVLVLLLGGSYLLVRPRRPGEPGPVAVRVSARTAADGSACKPLHLAR